MASVLLSQAPTNVSPIHTALPYPAVCLLIASVHASTTGHDTFTFEMLHDAFKTQVRTSQSAPVQVAGGGVGMVRCSREVLSSVRLPLNECKYMMEIADYDRPGRRLSGWSNCGCSCRPLRRRRASRKSLRCTAAPWIGSRYGRLSTQLGS